MATSSRRPRFSSAHLLRHVVLLGLLGLLGLLVAPAGCALQREGGLQTECATDGECDDANPCTFDVCSDIGTCQHDAQDVTLPQTAGDCREIVCDGGQVRAQLVDDPLDDGNDCTADVCVDGEPRSEPGPLNGETCSTPGGGGTCQGGVCEVKCDPAQDECDDGSLCTVDACDPATRLCVFDPRPNGAAEPSLQTPGDCRVLACHDGKEVNAIDDTDLPVPSTPCVTASCSEGVVLEEPRPTGTSCEDPGDPLAKLCDDLGFCVQCLAPNDCGHLPTDDSCQTRTCVSGVCGQDCMTAGTPITPQTVGNCLAEICDGACGMTTASDPTDVQVDAFECTNDICVSDAPAHPPKPVGTPCGQGGVCGATGICGQCNVASDCGQDSFCVTWACDVSQQCQPTFTPAGTVLPPQDQTAEDCLERQCDGAGVDVQVPVDDPIVDNNPCTADLCNAGMAQNPPEPLNTACPGGMFCDGAGTCVECNDSTQCTGDDGVCEDDLCVAKSCMIVPHGTNVPAPNQTPGDCLTIFCDGMGDPQGQPSVEDGDLPVDGDECTDDVCQNGTPDNPASPAETPCSTGVCNGDVSLPLCVECATDAQCAPGQICDVGASWSCLSDLGVACSSPTECASGQCIDGVCCASACSGTCVACDLPGSAGVCSAVPFNADPDDECAGGACNGLGACLLSNGGICGSGSQCLSDECVDGVCCDGPCSGLCEACNVAGSLGSCTFVAAGLDPGAECSAGACDGSGGCKLDLGEICGGPGDCLSGLCVDGVCCDDLCNGTCEACGSGTCTPHLSGTDPEAECGADVCGVGGACRCNDGVLNGSESDIDCGGSTCAACAAGMSCNGDADCASDVCLGNVCQPPICGDGKVNGSELCDVADPLTPCCAPACNGTAPAGVICGSDPDGSGCQAAPSCDGLGQGPASCLAGDEPNGTFCTDDTVFCNGAERCQGGLCLSDGDPCNGPDGDPDCNESCDEGTQSCTAYDGDGAPCLDGAFTVCNGGSCSQ